MRADHALEAIEDVVIAATELIRMGLPKIKVSASEDIVESYCPFCHQNASVSSDRLNGDIIIHTYTCVYQRLKDALQRAND